MLTFYWARRCGEAAGRLLVRKGTPRTGASRGGCTKQRGICAHNQGLTNTTLNRYGVVL